MIEDSVRVKPGPAFRRVTFNRNAFDDAIDQMEVLRAESNALIKVGVRPEFRWTDKTALPRVSEFPEARPCENAIAFEETFKMPANGPRVKNVKHG